MCQENRSQKDRCSHSNRNGKVVEIQAEIEESEAVQTVVIQVAIHTAITVVMVMRESDAGLASGTKAVSLEEVHRHRHGGLALRQPFFNQNSTDGYRGLLRFEVEVKNIPQTKTCKLTEQMKAHL